MLLHHSALGGGGHATAIVMWHRRPKKSKRCTASRADASPVVQRLPHSQFTYDVGQAAPVFFGFLERAEKHDSVFQKSPLLSPLPSQQA